MAKGTKGSKPKGARQLAIARVKDGNAVIDRGRPPHAMTKTLAAAMRLRTLGGLVELHSAAIEEVQRGDLSSNVANQINRLSGKHLSESKRQGRWPTKEELSELGAAVVTLLTKPSKRKTPPVSDSRAKARRVKRKKG